MVMVVSTAGIDGQERTSDIYGWATGAEVETVATSDYKRNRGAQRKSQRAKERRTKLLAAVDARLAKRAKHQK